MSSEETGSATEANVSAAEPAGRDVESMELYVALTSDEIIRGLKHYKRIARQDLLQAAEATEPDAVSRHAESRRAVYSHLADVAAREPATEVLREALRCYRQLPFVTGTPAGEHIEIKGQENALENFFLMVNLEPRVRREIRSQRQALP